MMTTFLVKQVNLGHGLLEGAIRDWGSENGGVPVSVVVLIATSNTVNIDGV